MSIISFSAGRLEAGSDVEENCRDEQAGHTPLAGIGGEEEGKIAAEGNGFHHEAADEVIGDGRKVIARVGIAFCRHLAGRNVIADDAVRHIRNTAAVACAEDDDVPLAECLGKGRAVVNKTVFFNGRFHARADDG